MHGVSSLNRKVVKELVQMLTNGIQGLLFFRSGSDLGDYRLGKKYLALSLTVIYFAS